jgi:hypothetical protein
MATRLPALPPLQSAALRRPVSGAGHLGAFYDIGDPYGGGDPFGGDGGYSWGDPGRYDTGFPPIIIGGGGGDSSGAQPATNASLTSKAGGLLSSILGIPAINWGRLAAFLLGLLFIMGGIFLIARRSTVVKTVVQTGKHAARLVGESAAEA